MPENTGTYTLTQTDGKLSIASATELDFTGYDRGHDGILYKQGFNFGDFEHFVDVHLTSSSSPAGSSYPFVAWAIANNVGTRKQLADGGFRTLQVLYAANGVNNFVQLIEESGGGILDVYIYSIGYFDHYITVSRSGTASTVKIYSDALKTTLLDTLSGTVGNDIYSTVYWFQAFGDILGSNTVTGSIQNLDLQIAPTFNPAWARNSNQIIGAGVMT